MLKLAQNETQALLLQLDQAIYNHAQWYDSIVRTLICRLPYDSRDVAKNAHRRCRFGQWYYDDAHNTLRDHPGFIAIETEHKNMHRLAANLLQTAASGATIASLDFDHFANTLERLRLECYTLKRELEDSLLNLDALTGAKNSQPRPSIMVAKTPSRLPCRLALPCSTRMSASSNPSSVPIKQCMPPKSPAAIARASGILPCEVPKVGEVALPLRSFSCSPIGIKPAAQAAQNPPVAAVG